MECRAWLMLVNLKVADCLMKLEWQIVVDDDVMYVDE